MDIDRAGGCKMH